MRALIDEAARDGAEPATRVLRRDGPGPEALHSMAFGDPEQAWAAAAEVSAETHVRYLAPR